MYWKVTNINQNQIEGWAYDEARPELDLQLVALEGNNIVGRAAADQPDHYLAGTEHAKPCSSFKMSLAGVQDVSAIKIVCMNCDPDNRRLILHSANKAEIGTYILPYQSYNTRGSSASGKKLEALSLGALKGKRVLDLGCNEGFFAIHALMGGAKRVVGIDSSSWFIELAKSNINDYETLNQQGKIDFRQTNWWDLPDEKFDLILFLSAIHYEKEQKKLLDLIHSRLSAQGLLILECGTVQGNSHNWVNVKRADDVVRYPTRNYLLNKLLDKFAVRETWQSVSQAGDPIPRYVYHCTPKKPIAMIVQGGVYSGKTVFARSLQKKSIPNVSSDAFFAMYSANSSVPEWAPNLPLYEFLRTHADTSHLDQLPEKLMDSGLIDDFCTEFIKTLPLDEEIFAIEGEVFSHPEIFKRFVKHLKASGVVVWSATNQR